MIRVLSLCCAAIGQFIRFCIWNGHDQEDAPNWASNHAQLIIIKVDKLSTYSQCVPEVKWILMLISRRVYIRWVQRAAEPSNSSKVNPRCILCCFIFVKIFFLYNLPFIPFSISPLSIPADAHIVYVYNELRPV